MLTDTAMLIILHQCAPRIVTKKQDFFADVAVINTRLQMLAVSESLLWIMFFFHEPEDKHSNPSLSQSMPMIFQFF
jgi:hypothetical protein